MSFKRISWAKLRIRPHSGRIRNFAGQLLLAFHLAACSVAPADAPATISPRAEFTGAPAASKPQTNAGVTATPVRDAAQLDPNIAPTGEPGLGDPLFPREGNGGIDVQLYDLDIAWSQRTGAISATATLTIKATQRLSAFNLDFHKMTVTGVTVDGTEARYLRRGDELVITLPAAVDSGNEFSVAIRYNGVPSGIKNFPASGWINLEDGAGAVVLGEPIVGKNWLPSNNHPLDKARFRYRVTVPKPFAVAANGMPETPVDNGTTRTFVFATRDPLPTYLASVAIDRFDRVEQEGPNGLPIINYLYSSGDAEAREPFERQPEMIAHFSTLFGPYPFEVAGATQISARLGVALEVQTRSVYGARTSERVVAHEIAHQWFGDHVAIKGWRDIWIKEGFASYAEGLWVEHTDGRDALDRWVTSTYEGLNGVRYEDLESLPALLEAYDVPDRPINVEMLRKMLAMRVVNLKDGIAQPVTLSAEQIDNVLADVPRGGGISNRSLTSLFEPLGFTGWKFKWAEAIEFYTLLGLRGLPSARTDLDQRFAAPPGRVDTADERVMYSQGVYRRGALTLHALRLEVGDEAFFKTLREYVTRYGGANASGEDFEALAAEVSGRDLAPLFDAWLRGKALPDMPALDLRAADFR
jgi:aminopeptidase N